MQRGKKKTSMRGQSAIEYLITYSWAILIIAIVAVLLYIYAAGSTAIVPSRCSFTNDVDCSDVVFGGSADANAMLLLSNPQPYVLINPSIITSIGNSGNATGTCTPSYILPGGAFYCVVSVPGTYVQGSTQFADLYLKGIPCTSGNAMQCDLLSPQTYTGTFQTQYQAKAPVLQPVILLAIANSTTPVSTEDLLKAHVIFSNTVIQGADLNFTSNDQYMTFSPQKEATDSSGNAYTYLEANQPGLATVTVSFGVYSNSITVNVISGDTVTFEESGGWSTDNVLIVDGQDYGTDQLPLTFTWQPGSSHAYVFEDDPYAPNAIGGCGTASASGMLTMVVNCTVTATYVSPQQLGMAEEGYPNSNPPPTYVDNYVITPSSDSANLIWCGSAAPNNALWTGGSSPSVNCPSQAPYLLTTGAVNINPLAVYSQPGTYFFFGCDKATAMLDCTQDNGAGVAGVTTIPSSGSPTITIAIGAPWGPGTG